MSDDTQNIQMDQQTVSDGWEGADEVRPNSTTEAQAMQARKDEEVAWDFPEIGTMEEEKKKRVKLFEPQIYFVQCTEYKITKSPNLNMYTGEYDINCTWQFKIIKSLDGKPLKYSSGEKAQFDTFPVWTNVTNMGAKKDGKPQDTRAIMAALLGLPANAKLPKPDRNNFVGKYARVVCEIGAKKDGSPKQLWSAWATWDGR